MRIGLFGGSFDPIHYGHLILAERCREQAQLDEIWLTPASTNPHKQDGPRATDKQRLEMIRLAIGGHRPFVLSEIELERGGLSYTVDTLRKMNEQHPDAELFFLVGGDSLDQFHRWHQPDQICQLAIPLVVGRPGSEPADWSVFSEYVSSERLDVFRSFAVESPLIDISSTEIRSRVAAGQSIRFLTPRAVEKYIETQKMYLHRDP